MLLWMLSIKQTSGNDWPNSFINFDWGDRNSVDQTDLICRFLDVQLICRIYE